MGRPDDSEEVAGNPRDMLVFYGAATEQVDDWAAEVSELQAALDTLRLAMGVHEIPETVAVPVPDFALVLDGVTKDQQHLDRFVKDVAHELLRAGGYGQALASSQRRGHDYTPPDQVITADADDIDVGPADRWAAANEAGTADAAELHRLLDDSGLLGGDLFNALDRDDPNYDAIVSLLRNAGARMDDPAYATVFYNTLGADGTLSLAAVLYEFGLQEDPGSEIAASDTFTRQLADPMVAGFAAASGSLDPEVRAELLAGEHSGDRHLDAVRLSILLSAPGMDYEPVFLAEAADAVVFDTHATPTPAQAIAFRALAENPEASWEFASMSEDHHATLFYPPDVAGMRRMPAEATYTWLDTPVPRDLEDLYELWSAAVYLNAVGVPIDYQDSRGNPTALPWRTGLSMGVDFIPLVGDAKAVVEVTSGEDYIGGEPVNRWFAAIGLVPLAGGPLKKLGRWVRNGFKRAEVPPLPSTAPHLPDVPPRPNYPPRPSASPETLRYPLASGWLTRPRPNGSIRPLDFPPGQLSESITRFNLELMEYYGTNSRAYARGVFGNSADTGNCQWVALVRAHFLDTGEILRPRGSAPAGSAGIVNTHEMQRYYGSHFSNLTTPGQGYNLHTSQNRITQAYSAPGSQGLLHISWKKDGETLSHVFNVYNVDGTIYYANWNKVSDSLEDILTDIVTTGAGPPPDNLLQDVVSFENMNLP